MSDNLFTVRILEREYRVTCGPDEQDGLLRAARYLDGRMRDIRGKGKVVGVERIAVMTALNLAHDFLQQGCDRDGQQNQVDTRLRHMQEKIEIALNQNAQLEV